MIMTINLDVCIGCTLYRYAHVWTLDIWINMNKWMCGLLVLIIQINIWTQLGGCGGWSDGGES